MGDRRLSLAACLGEVCPAVWGPKWRHDKLMSMCNKELTVPDYEPAENLPVLMGKANSPLNTPYVSAF